MSGTPSFDRFADAVGVAVADRVFEGDGIYWDVLEMAQKLLKLSPNRFSRRTYSVGLRQMRLAVIILPWTSPCENLIRLAADAQHAHARRGADDAGGRNWADRAGDRRTLTDEQAVSDIGSWRAELNRYENSSGYGAITGAEFMQTLHFGASADFRHWLEKNHTESDGIWLRIFKKGIRMRNL